MKINGKVYKKINEQSLYMQELYEEFKEIDEPVDIYEPRGNLLDIIEDLLNTEVKEVIRDIDDEEIEQLINLCEKYRIEELCMELKKYYAEVIIPVLKTQEDLYDMYDDPRSDKIIRPTDKCAQDFLKKFSWFLTETSKNS